MSLAHTWRLALPDQRCQERRCYQLAAYALVIKGSMSGEELLCAMCAPHVARQFGLSDPTNSSAGADASAQTSEAHAVTSSMGLVPKEVGPQ